MSKFINFNKKSYEESYVVEKIKSSGIFSINMKASIELYEDTNWCDQFLSSIFDEFEIVVVKNVKGFKDGFYVVDRNYTKFTTSSFIQKQLMKGLSTIGMSNSTLLRSGVLMGNNKDKRIDRYFVEYIRDNTILYYTEEEYKKEFFVSTTKGYQPHTKSAHTVNGFWRNQPYGSRNNPQYKKIWIEEFERGVA